MSQGTGIKPTIFCRGFLLAINLIS